LRALLLFSGVLITYSDDSQAVYRLPVREKIALSVSFFSLFRPRQHSRRAADCSSFAQRADWRRCVSSFFPPQKKAKQMASFFFFSSFRAPEPVNSFSSLENGEQRSLPSLSRRSVEDRRVFCLFLLGFLSQFGHCFFSHLCRGRLVTSSTGTFALFKLWNILPLFPLFLCLTSQSN